MGSNFYDLKLIDRLLDIGNSYLSSCDGKINKSNDRYLLIFSQKRSVILYNVKKKKRLKKMFYNILFLLYITKSTEIMTFSKVQ